MGAVGRGPLRHRGRAGPVVDGLRPAASLTAHEDPAGIPAGSSWLRAVVVWVGRSGGRAHRAEGAMKSGSWKWETRGPLGALAIGDHATHGVHAEQHGDRQEDQEEGHGSNHASVAFLPRVAGMPLYVDFLPRVRHDGPMAQIEAVEDPVQNPIQTVAVIVQDGAEPFGLGLARGGVGRARAPRGRHPGLRLPGVHAAAGPGAGAAPTSTCSSSAGWTRSADADLVCLAAQLRLPQPRPRGARGGAGGVRPRRDPLRALLGRVRPRRGRAARRARVHHALALHRRSSRRCTPRPRCAPTSSTATTATSSPAPARRPASTRRCT